jgi:hypothetical protein
MTNKHISFSQIPVRSYFYFEGVRWYKRSKRTANVAGYSTRWKPFVKADMVQLKPNN